MCQTQRPRLAQRLSILHQDQHFFKRHRASRTWIPAAGGGELSFLLFTSTRLYWLPMWCRLQVSLSRMRFGSDTIRPCQYKIYLKQDIKKKRWCGKQVRQCNLAHAIHHVPVISHHTELLVRYKTAATILRSALWCIFKVWPWLSSRCVPLMHMLSPEVIRTWAICSPLYSWRGDEAGLVYSFQVTHVDRSWMLMVLHVRLSVTDCVFSHSNRSHNILFFVFSKDRNLPICMCGQNIFF